MPTIKKIAEKAGVSIGIVDRVIHKRGNVSKDTEEQVKKAIAELNYRPNIFAQHLKLNRNFIFGVLMPEFTQDNNFWNIPANAIKTALDESKSHKIKAKFFQYDRYSQLSFASACQEILNTRLDGLLLAPLLSKIAKEFIDKMPEDLPIIFFDSIMPNVKYLSAIMQDSFLSGQLSAKLMKMLIITRNYSIAYLTLWYFPVQSW